MAPRRWTPQTLLESMRSFQEARILMSAVELGVFTTLAKSQATASQVRQRLSTDERATGYLLDALVAMGLLAKKGGKYSLPGPIAKALDPSSRESIVPMVMHGTHLWQRWGGLTDIVKKGQPMKAFAPHKRDPVELESFILAMDVVARQWADSIVKAVQPKAMRLLDVGAGPATYTKAFLKADPKLKATIFDLPPVVEIAKKQLARDKLLKRVDLVAGDFYKDPLPQGNDLVFLSAIIHQNSPEQNRELYGKILAALVPGGRLVIRDHVMDASRTWPPGGALFAINMLVGTPGGGTYTFKEISDDLKSVGFRRIKQIRTGEMMDSLVEAWKP